MRPTAIALRFFPLFLLIAAAGADSSATQPLVFTPTVRPIGRASTSAELAATDDIDSIVGPLHIAVEATTLPAFGSTDIYLRTDPPSSPHYGPAIHINGFPLTLRLSSPNMHHPSPPINVGLQTPLYESRFFIARVTLGPPGNYTLELLDRNVVLARTHLTATHDQALRWQPLLGRGKTTLDPEPAVPLIDGTLPYPVPLGGSLPSSAPPAEPDPHFRLSVKGNTFTIKQWPVGNFFPEQQLLAAFYINGKRFTPKIPTHFKEVPDAYQLNNSPGGYTFTLNVDPATLGAKPTDHIEMELLCSPYGFQKLSINKIMRGGSLDPMALSNRVTISTPKP